MLERVSFLCENWWWGNFRDRITVIITTTGAYTMGSTGIIEIIYYIRQLNLYIPCLTYTIAEEYIYWDGVYISRSESLLI